MRPPGRASSGMMPARQTSIDRWERDKGTLSEAYRISGNYYYSGDCAPITCWLVDHEPEVIARTRLGHLPCPRRSSTRLTGNIKLGYGDAPSLEDTPRQRSYSRRDLRTGRDLHDETEIPHAVLSREVAGHVTRRAAAETGLKEGTPVILAECDVSSTATGLGVTEDGGVGIIVGTAHVVSVCQSELVFGPETGALTVLMPYLDAKYLKLTGPSIATPNLDWFVDNFGDADRTAAAGEGLSLYDYLDRQLKQIPAGSDGVLYHPYLSPGGERAPMRKPAAKGNFFGLDMHHTRHHLLRSVYEAVRVLGAGLCPGNRCRTQGNRPGRRRLQEPRLVPDRSGCHGLPGHGAGRG